MNPNHKPMTSYREVPNEPNPLFRAFVEADEEVRRIEQELKASSSQYQWACRIRDNAWTAYEASKAKQAAKT